ncbi:hypothetical protein GCM10009601_16180 [Streptomyces thermospinosisporus]|uniref:Uncharacterized protein n=1 Tax=Streptomyces thermospinosisporus TaxID=161482 RepID=A0ABP4JIM0_9ACTN
MQQVGVGLEGVDAERVEEACGAQRVAEAAQAVELGERADQFRLVVGVLVVAVRGVHGNAAALLVLEAFPGLLQVGVDLEGEGCAGGEELEQERQAGAEPGDTGGAEFLLGGGVDDLGEGAAGGAGGGAGVGAHPHLGLRFAGGFGAEEPRDGGGGTPGVGADGVLEAVHGALGFLLRCSCLSPRQGTGGQGRFRVSRA